MKKLIALVASLALIVTAIGGCSTPMPGSTVESSTSGSGAAQDIVTINYYGRPDDKGVESTIVANFEKENPDIKINYVELPDTSSDRLKTISTVLQAGDASIDVFAGDVVWPPIFVSAGWVVPLDSYLQTGELDQYLAGPLSAFQIQGKTYGLPFMADSGALYYRSDLLSKYNQPVPTTNEEMIAAAKIILEGEKSASLKGYSSYWKQAESLACVALEMYWAKGGDIVDGNGKSVVDEAKMTETLTLMKSMMDTENMTVAGIETFGTTESRNEVMAGNAVFTRDWLSGYAPFNEGDSKVAGNMEIAVIPGNGTLGGWGVMVSEFSKNKDAAVEFAKFRASYDSQVAANEITRIVPTIKAIYEDADVLALTPHLPKFIPLLEGARPRPQSPYYAELSGIMQLEMHSVISGMTTPQAASESIKQKIDTLLS